MPKKRNGGVPALHNEKVTGMEEDKQEEVIRQSGRARRAEAAKEFYDEGEQQARTSEAPGDASTRKGAAPTRGKSVAEHGTQGEDATELQQHWAEGSKVSRRGAGRASRSEHVDSREAGRSRGHSLGGERGEQAAGRRKQARDE
jgi:hypothetical protein